MGIEETIPVRPRSAPTNIIQGEKTLLQNTSREIDSQPRRPQRMWKPSGLFASHTQFALLAGQEEYEPQTLTDALNCNERAEWRAAWESQLTSLAKNNTWVIEPLPEC